MTDAERVVLSSAAVLTFSAVGLGLLKVHEDTVRTAYLDPVGIPTICTGSTKKVFLGHTASLAECEERLKEDTGDAGKAVARLVQHKLSQGQYDALVSFVFNVGSANFSKSTLLKKLNAGDCKGAGQQFYRWIYADGRKLRGLEKRRADEAQRWLKDCHAWY